MIVDFEKYESRLREELTEKQFEAFYRMAHEDKSARRVGTELGITNPALKCRIMRARRTIRGWHDKPKIIRKCRYKYCNDFFDVTESFVKRFYCNPTCLNRAKCGIGDLTPVEKYTGENHCHASVSSNAVVTAIALVRAGCSQTATAEWLTSIGIDTTQAAISRWINGTNRKLDLDKYERYMRRDDESKQQAQG